MPVLLVAQRVVVGFIPWTDESAQSRVYVVEPVWTPPPLKWEEGPAIPDISMETVRATLVPDAGFQGWRIATSDDTPEQWTRVTGFRPLPEMYQGHSVQELVLSLIEPPSNADA